MFQTLIHSYMPIFQIPHVHIINLRFDEMIIVIPKDSASLVPTLNKAVYTSYRTITPVRGMNPTIIPPATSKTLDGVEA